MDSKNKIVGDINSDLISVFIFTQQEGQDFIDYVKSFFKDSNNIKSFTENRLLFNNTNNTRERAALFIYLNRHCYNGLCRYNSKGIFNVPFGRYTTIHFPEKEMKNICDKASNVRFYNYPFEKLFAMANKSTTIYCDPPYDPVSETSHFTAYDKNKFGKEQQILLARQVMQSPAKVVVSNSDTPFIRNLYKECRFQEVMVRRNISCKSRDRVGELLIFKT